MRQIPTGQRRHLVILENPGAPVADADGGYTHTWAACTPSTWYVAIEPPSARDLERLAHDTVTASRASVMAGPYHPQITTQTRITFGTRVFSVAGLDNPEERSIDLVVLAVEVIA